MVLGQGGGIGASGSTTAKQCGGCTMRIEVRRAEQKEETTNRSVCQELEISAIVKVEPPTALWCMRALARIAW